MEARINRCNTDLESIRNGFKFWLFHKSCGCGHQRPNGSLGGSETEAGVLSVTAQSWSCSDWGSAFPRAQKLDLRARSSERGAGKRHSQDLFSGPPCSLIPSSHTTSWASLSAVGSRFPSIECCCCRQTGVQSMACIKKHAPRAGRPKRGRCRWCEERPLLYRHLVPAVLLTPASAPTSKARLPMALTLPPLGAVSIAEMAEAPCEVSLESRQAQRSCCHHGSH